MPPLPNRDNPSQNTNAEEEAGSMTNTGQGSNIVRDFTIGNTRIKIADDCCRDKTPEDVRKILKEIARAAQAAISAAAFGSE